MTAEEEQIQSATGIEEPPLRRPPKWSQITRHEQWKSATPEKRIKALERWGMDVARYEKVQPDTPEYEALSTFIEEQYKKFRPGTEIGVARQIASAPVKAFGSTVGQMVSGGVRFADMITGEETLGERKERRINEASVEADSNNQGAYTRYLQAVRDAGFDPKDQTLASPRIFKNEQAAMDAGLQRGQLALIGGRKKRIGFDLETFRDPANEERDGALGDMAMPTLRHVVATGEGITAAAQAIPTNPNYDEQFLLGDVLAAAGSVPAYLGVGLFGGPWLVAAAGVSQQMENAYQTAVAEGKPELALEQMIYQSPIGVLQTVGVGGIPMRKLLRDTAFGKQIQQGAWRYVFAGSREAFQESLLGGLPTDISEYYGGVRPDDSPWTADAWVRRMREAGAGFIAGAGVTAAQAKVEKAHAFKALQGLAVVDAMEQIVDGTAPQMQELKAVVEDKSAPPEARAEAEAKIEEATQKAEQYLEQADEQLKLGKQEVNTPTPAEPATPAEQQPASEQRTQESQPPVVRESESLQEVTPDAEVETSQNREVEAALEAGEQGAAEGVDVESGRSDEAVASEAVSAEDVQALRQGYVREGNTYTYKPEQAEAQLATIDQQPSPQSSEQSGLGAGAATVTEQSGQAKVAPAAEVLAQVDESTPARVEEAYGTEPERTDTTAEEAGAGWEIDVTRSGEASGSEVSGTEFTRSEEWTNQYRDRLMARAEQLGLKDPQDAHDAARQAVLIVSKQDVQGDPLPLLYTNLKQRVADIDRRRKAAGRDVRQTSSLDAPLSAEGDMTLADTQESGEATPAQAAEASDRAQMVQAAVQKLPERQRLLVQRIFFEGKKPADVARELGLSKTTIGKDYQAASTALKEALISLSNDATPQTADRRLGLVPESFHRTQAVLRWFREWATTWKNVPRELVPSLESAEASERAHYERGRMIIRDLKREQRRAYGRKDLDRAETELRDALLNPDAMDVLPPKVKQEAMRLRNLMDELSLRVVNEVITDPDFALTILDNTGSYMRRSYRVFSDPEWHKKVDPITLQQGKAWIRDNWDKKRTLTDEETDIVAAELLDPSKAGGFMLGGSKVGGKDVTSLIKRKEIAPEIRALMGEITNPFDSAAETVKRQASLIENHHAQQAMRRVGLESGLFTDRKTPTHFKELAGVKNPGPYDVMAGLYTTPETFDALTGHYKGSGKLTFLGGVMEFFRSASGTAKMTKTILAPVTWPVNYIGAYMDLIPQGNFNPASYLRGVDHVLEKTGIWSRVNGRTVVDRQKLQDQIVKMARYGLMDQNLTANDMIRAVNKSLVGRVPLVKDATRVSGTIFQSGDNIVKFAAWEQEMARYKKAFPNMPEAELEARVAEIVAQTTQMYERTPVVLKDASTILPIQSFVNFLYDTNRKIVNTARLAKSEISEGNRTGNKELTKIGTTRAVAMTTTLVASSSLGVALMSRLFNGVDEDEEEAMRFFMPPWFEDNNIFWASGIDKGVATYANAGYLLPHANALQPFEAGWRKGEGVEGVFNETVNAFASQYLQEPVHLNPILDAARNTTQTGRRIVNEEDPNKTSKLLGYVAKKTWEPGIVRQIDRMWMAINNESGIYGQEFTVKSEIYRMVGLRAQDVDVRKQLPFKARDLNQRWQNATNLYKLSRNRNLSETEMERRYADSEAARQEVFNEFVKMRTYGNRVGLTDSEIIAAMRNTPGISRALVSDVLRGQYRPAPKD